jgi:XPG N-terminal domain
LLPLQMGVKDLWHLLEPVGRRINIEALTNKQLAVGKGNPVKYDW